MRCRIENTVIRQFGLVKQAMDSPEAGDLLVDCGWPKGTGTTDE